MKKAAFIGPRQYSESLRLIGIETFQADSTERALAIIEDLKNKDYRIIFASNDILKEGAEGVVILPGLVKKAESDFLKKIIKKTIGKEIKIQ